MEILLFINVDLLNDDMTTGDIISTKKEVPSLGLTCIPTTLDVQHAQSNHVKTRSSEIVFRFR